jgi:hypothetical protein
VASILGALTREFLQRGRLRLVIATMVPAGLQSLNYLLLLSIGSSPETRRDLMMHEMVVFWSFVAAVFAITPSLSDARVSLPRRLYTLPITTRLLVGWRILLGMVTAAAIYLFSALFCYGLLSVSYPLFGPAVFVAAGLALVLAMFWSITDFSLWKIPLCGLGATGLIVRWSVRYDNQVSWTQVAAIDYAVVFVAVLVAYVVATHSVARDRCGRSRSWPDLQDLYNRLTDRLGRSSTAFGSAESAQLWCEWKPRGGIIPCLLAGLMLCIVAGITLHEYFHPPQVMSRDTLNSFIMTGGMIVPILGGAITGLFIGDRAHKRSSFDAYTATRPLSDASLARILLRAITLSTLLSWVVCWGCIVLGLVLFSLVGNLGDSGDARAWLGRGLQGHAWWAWAVLVLTALAALGLSLAVATWTGVLVAAGRIWLFTAIGLLVFGVPLTAMTFAILDLPAWFLQHCGSGLMLGVGMLGVGLGGWAILSAWLNESLGTRFVAFAALTWMCGLVAISLAGLPRHSGATAAFLLGLLALALTPPALAPRAIAWNRHR